MRKCTRLLNLIVLSVTLSIFMSGCVNKAVENAVVHNAKKIDAQQAGLVTLNINERYVLKDIYKYEDSEDFVVASKYYDDTEGSEGLLQVEVSNEDYDAYIKLLDVAIKLDKTKIQEYKDMFFSNLIQGNIQSRKLILDLDENATLEVKDFKGSKNVIFKSYSEKYNTSIVLSICSSKSNAIMVTTIKRDNLENTYKDAKKVLDSIMYNGKSPDIEFEEYDEEALSLGGFLHDCVVMVDGEDSQTEFEFDSDLKSIGDTD